MRLICYTALHEERSASGRSTFSAEASRQFSLRTLLSLVSAASVLFSAFTFPGVGGVLLTAFACLLPALVVIGGLVLLQFPLMLLAARFSRVHRNRQREERQAFIVPRPRG